MKNAFVNHFPVLCLNAIAVSNCVMVIMAPALDCLPTFLFILVIDAAYLISVIRQKQLQRHRTHVQTIS